MAQTERPIVRVLLGPTGAGKTELTARLDPARYEIVSCDSRQVYREMPVGTAVPEPEIRARLPHHLVEIIAPSAEINAGAYGRLAGEALREVFARGRQPVLVGGAGFYYRALKTGLFDRAAADPATREFVRSLPHEERLARLRAVDALSLQNESGPPEQGRIHPRDAYRVERALEVFLATGVPWSEHWRRARETNLAAKEFRFMGFFIEMERRAYGARVLERARRMVGSGLVAEAARLLERYGDCPGLNTLGYHFALRAARGELKDEQLVQELTRAHLQYGKRQRTWFRGEPELRPTQPEDLRKKMAGGRFPDEFLDFSEN